MATKGQPFSIRLSRETEELVLAEARRTKRSRGAVVEALTEEALRSRLFPGVVFTGPESQRRASVAGTGFDVWQVIAAYGDFGSVERLVDAFSLDERRVRLALAYYERFPDEIDEAIADNSRPIEELRRQYPFATVVELGDQ